MTTLTPTTAGKQVGVAGAAAVVPLSKWQQQQRLGIIISLVLLLQGLAEGRWLLSRPPPTTAQASTISTKNKTINTISSSINTTNNTTTNSNISSRPQCPLGHHRAAVAAVAAAWWS